MSDPSQRVTCPSCDKGYRWQPNLVGRQVNCKQCGGEFKVPDQPGVGITLSPEPVNDEGGYELDLDSLADTPNSSAHHAAPANNGKCPSCNSPVREAAVLCMNCGFNMAEGKKTQTAVADTPAEGDEIDNGPGPTKQQQREIDRAAAAHAQYWWQDYKLPFIFIIAGLVMVLLNNLIIGPNSPMVQKTYGDTVTAIIGLTLETAYATIVHSVLLFGGLLLLVKLFGAGYGTLTSVLLRVLAISLISQEAEFMALALMDIAMGTGGFGWVISWTVYLGFMVGLTVKLLDVDMTEFRVLFWFILIGRLATNYTIALILNAVL